MRALAAAALLAAPWSAPAPLGGGGSQHLPQVSFGPQGRVVAWQEFDPGAGNTVGLSTGRELPGELAGASGRSLLRVVRGRLVVGPIAGRGGEQVLARGPVLTPALAGPDAAAWVGGSTLRLRSRHGARVGRVHVLARGRRMAIVRALRGPGGVTAVFYVRRRELLAVIGRRHFDLGPSSGLAVLDAAYTPAGRLVAVWGDQDPGEEAGRPWVVRTASLARGGERFTPPVVLDAGGAPERSPGTVRVACTADHVVAAWTSVQRGPTSEAQLPAVAAVADPSGRFGPPQTLDAAGALGDLAVLGGGYVIAAWQVDVFSVSGEARPVRAALLAPGASSFGDAEEIAPNGVAGSLPDLAVGPNGKPTAAWSGFPPDSHTPRIFAADRG